MNTYRQNEKNNIIDFSIDKIINNNVRNYITYLFRKYFFSYLDWFIYI